MLLSYTELKTIVEMGVMSPVREEHINASSIDVTLGPTLLVEDPGIGPDRHAVLRLRDRTPLNHLPYDLGLHPYRLLPGQFVLAQTLEKFYMPLNMSAEFRLKSSAARMGLSHALAVWVDPGWTGSVLTLELHNISQFHVIELNAGDRVGQMIFHKHRAVPKGEAYSARGSYNNDTGPSVSKFTPSIGPVGDGPKADSERQ